MSDKAPPHDCWTPGRIVAALERGRMVPHDWRERLIRAGYVVPEPTTVPTLFDIPATKGE